MEENQKRTKKILWIDDDVNNPELQSERDALEERGCIITPVTNPDDLQFDNISSFDCIITDLAMPVGMTLDLVETRYGTRTGFVIIKKIKERFPDSKLIVYSVFDVPEVRAYCNDNKIQYWYKSNFLPDDFADEVINVINGSEV